MKKIFRLISRTKKKITPEEQQAQKLFDALEFSIEEIVNNRYVPKKRLVFKYLAKKVFDSQDKQKHDLFFEAINCESSSEKRVGTSQQLKLWTHFVEEFSQPQMRSFCNYIILKRLESHNQKLPIIAVLVAELITQIPLFFEMITKSFKTLDYKDESIAITLVNQFFPEIIRSKNLHLTSSPESSFIFIDRFYAIVDKSWGIRRSSIESSGFYISQHLYEIIKDYTKLSPTQSELFTLSKVFIFYIENNLKNYHLKHGTCKSDNTAGHLVIARIVLNYYQHFFNSFSKEIDPHLLILIKSTQKVLDTYKSASFDFDRDFSEILSNMHESFYLEPKSGLSLQEWEFESKKDLLDKSDEELRAMRTADLQKISKLISKLESGHFYTFKDVTENSRSLPTVLLEYDFSKVDTIVESLDSKSPVPSQTVVEALKAGTPMLYVKGSKSITLQGEVYSFKTILEAENFIFALQKLGAFDNHHSFPNKYIQIAPQDIEHCQSLLNPQETIRLNEAKISSCTTSGTSNIYFIESRHPIWGFEEITVFLPSGEIKLFEIHPEELGYNKPIRIKILQEIFKTTAPTLKYSYKTSMVSYEDLPSIKAVDDIKTLVASADTRLYEIGDTVVEQLQSIILEMTKEFKAQISQAHTFGVPPEEIEIITQSPYRSAFCYQFDLEMNNVYLAISAIMSGKIDSAQRGTLGVIADVGNFVSTMVPMFGSGVQVVSLLLGKLDEHMQLAKMRHFQALASNPIDFANISKTLAHKFALLDISENSEGFFQRIERKLTGNKTPDSEAKDLARALVQFITAQIFDEKIVINPMSRPQDKAEHLFQEIGKSGVFTISPLETFDYTGIVTTEDIPVLAYGVFDKNDLE